AKHRADYLKEPLLNFVRRRRAPSGIILDISQLLILARQPRRLRANHIADARRFAQPPEQPGAFATTNQSGQYTGHRIVSVAQSRHREASKDHRRVRRNLDSPMTRFGWPFDRSCKPRFRRLTV